MLYLNVVDGKNAMTDCKSTTDKILKDLAFRKNENIRLQKAISEYNEKIKHLRDALSKLEQEAKLRIAADEENMQGEGRELDRWFVAIRKLKNFIMHHPQYAIPEFKYLTAKDWLAATESGTMQSEANYRAALAELRQTATLAASSIFGQAVKDFINANNGNLPTKLGDITKYLPPDFDPDILERYETNKSGNTDEEVWKDGQWIITEAGPPIDNIWNSQVWVSNTGEVYDKGVGMGIKNGAWTVDSVQSAISNYVKANGSEPTSFDQINEYIDAKTNKWADKNRDKIDEIFQSLMKK